MFEFFLKFILVAFISFIKGGVTLVIQTCYWLRSVPSVQFQNLLIG